MNWFALLSLVFLLISPSLLRAQASSATQLDDAFSTNSPPSDQANSGDDEGRPTPLELLKAWRSEHDPIKRRKLGGDLLAAAVMNQDDSGEPLPSSLAVADEIARDGAARNELRPSGVARTIRLGEIMTLKGAKANVENDYGNDPLVFRRISAQRVEVWAHYEGWLFDQHGRLVVNAHLPDRGDNENQWYGAFLPDGQWITAYWDSDDQLNTYTKDSVWQWELLGKAIVAKLPPPPLGFEKSGLAIVPTIAWVRGDKTGERWLVGLGQDFSRGFALVDPQRRVQPLAADTNVWNEVYPRSMGVRGNSWTQNFIPSDDGRKVLAQCGSPRGAWADWDGYAVFGWGKVLLMNSDDDTTNRNVVIHNGTFSFGFWPHSYCTYRESESSVTKPVRRVWFFDATGKYEGEVMASHLGDAANDRDLIVRDRNGHVLQITRTKGGPKIVESRVYTWPDGTPAIPVAIYDDLRYGFFLRNPSQTSNVANSSADISFGKW